MLLGIRVVKTALAGLAAIYTALYLNLEPALSAGLLAILGVEVTRLKGIRNAFVRMMASVLGLFLASLLFALFGFEIWTLSLFILIAFPVLSRMQLKDGIVTSSVIVFHVFERQEVTAGLIANEIMLLATGLGWALIINLLYMPRVEGKLGDLRLQTERLLGRIFQKLAVTLRDPAYVWNGEEMLRVEALIQEGVRQCEVYQENRIWRYEKYWHTYFSMRERQLEAVHHMLALVALVYERLPQGELLAELFEELALEVKSDRYEGKVERELAALEARFREMPLPATREEFEVRAALLQLCHELSGYLAVAKRWKKQKAAEPEMDV